MKNLLGLTFTALAIVAFTASQSDARGGGHGGGHHGGGHHGGGHHHSHHHNHHHNHHHTAHHGGRAFGNGWGGGYGWNHGYGNAWAGAGWGAAATWLGLSALNNGGGYATNPTTNTTVYTSDNGDNSANQGQPVANTNAQPEQTLTADQATGLAKTGTNAALAADANFLPLGVFSLAPEKQTEASALVHLALSKDGVLRGSYYDVLSSQEHEIHGAVDKKTQRAAWTVQPNGKVVFETSLKNLTTDEASPLSVHYEDGKTSAWTLARFEDDSDDGDDDSDDDDADDKAPAAPAAPVQQKTGDATAK